MWIRTFEVGGIEFEVTSIDSPNAVSEARLMFSLSSLEDVTPESFSRIQEWFEQNIDELQLVCSFPAYMYEPQYFTVDQLNQIAVSEFASDMDKAKANEGLRNPTAGRQRELRERKKRPGQVYLLKSETEHYKIGRSSTPEKRLKIFSVEMPIDVQLVHSFKADCMITAEETLHKGFEHNRFRGEWFNLDSDAVNWIKRIGSFENGKFYMIEESG